MQKVTENQCWKEVVCLSRGWAVTRLEPRGLAESITRKERLRSIYTSHTPSGKPVGVALHTALHLSHPCGCALGQPARQASALVLEDTRATS